MLLWAVLRNGLERITRVRSLNLAGEAMITAEPTARAEDYYLTENVQRGLIQKNWVLFKQSVGAGTLVQSHTPRFSPELDFLPFPQ